MFKLLGHEPLLNNDALLVTVADGEVLVDGQGSAMPSLSAVAARATGFRLIQAADELELSYQAKYACSG